VRHNREDKGAQTSLARCVCHFDSSSSLRSLNAAEMGCQGDAHAVAGAITLAVVESYELGCAGRSRRNAHLASAGVSSDALCPASRHVVAVAVKRKAGVHTRTAACMHRRNICNGPATAQA